jgi:hypothetical protein
MDTTFTAEYDAETSTLRLAGTFEPAAWALVAAAVDRAFRRAALRLTIDLTRAEGVPPHELGVLVHLCNCCYAGTVVRVPRRTSRAADAPVEQPVRRAA